MGMKDALIHMTAWQTLTLRLGDVIILREVHRIAMTTEDEAPKEWEI